MKILVVTQYFWPENFRINDLTVGLVQKGHEVTVVTGVPNYPEGKYFAGYGLFKNLKQEYHGVKILRLPVIPRGCGGRARLTLNYFSFMVSGLIFAPFICRGKFDLIFVYEPSPITVGLPAILLKKIKSAPVFLWVQDLWPESLSATGAIKTPLLLKLVKKLVHFIYHECSLILVQSKAFIPSILSFGVDSSRITYFPNSAEEFYHSIELESDAIERREIPQGFIVMFAGNIGASQDFATIISAAEKLRDHPDIYWVIIGDGRRRQWAEDEVVALNLCHNFIFLGRHPAELMPRYFALADILLVTLKDEEIFALTIPTKIQSYLACAKPIIASLAGEGAKIIEDSKSGFSCSPGDSSKLAELVLKMYSMDVRKRQAMGLNGRKYFENNFSREKLINQLDKMFENLKGVEA